MDPPGDRAEPPRALMLQDTVEVACPVAVVRHRLYGRVGSLAGMADAADRDGDALMTRIGPAWAHGLLARRVVVQLGPCRERDRSLVLPIEWRAAERSSLFPVLSGDLELVPVSSDASRIVLSASYLPPLGDLGRSLDRALLHRVASSTVRSFLRTLAAGLEAEEPVPQVEGGPATASWLAPEGGW